MDISIDNASVLVDTTQPTVVTRCVRRACRSTVHGASRRLLLRPTTLSIPRGTVTTVMAPSGSGTTTFLKAIAHSNSLSTGKVFFPTVAKEEATLAFVDTQRLLLPSLTVRETMAFACAMHNPPIYGKNKRAADIEDPTMEAVFLQECVDTRVEYISDGQYLRLKLGMALLPSPRVLLIDSKVLDNAEFEREEMVLTLKKLAHEGGMTIVIGVDRHSIAAQFDNVIVLANGAVLYAGDVAKAVPYFCEVTECEIRNLDEVLAAISCVQHKAPVPRALSARSSSHHATAAATNRKKTKDGYAAVSSVELEEMPMDSMTADVDFDVDEEDSAESPQDRLHVATRFGMQDRVDVSAADEKKGDVQALVQRPRRTGGPRQFATAFSIERLYATANERLQHHNKTMIMKRGRQVAVAERSAVLQMRNGFWIEFKQLFVRFAKTAWRAQSDLGLTLLLLAICALVTFGIWQTTSLGDYAIVHQQALLLFVMLFVTSIVTHANITYWVKTAKLFVPDTQAGLYEASAYICAQSAWSFLQVSIVTLLFVVPTTYSVFYHWSARETTLACVITVLHAATHSALVETIVMALRSELRAHVTSMTIAYISFWLAGYIVPFVDMAPAVQTVASSVSYTENALRALIHLAVPRTEWETQVLGFGPPRSIAVTLVFGFGLLVLARMLFAVVIVALTIRHHLALRLKQT